MESRSALNKVSNCMAKYVPPPVFRSKRREGGTRSALLAFVVMVLFAWDVGAGEIYGYYTRIDSGEAFEQFSRVGDYADITVKLNSPEGRMVFWRGSSYLPYWETKEGKWFLEEIVQRHGDGEGMRPDKVNAFSHVALVESSKERALVYWRYLSQFEAGNPHPNVDETKFIEEYFTITSDGKVVRTIKQAASKIDDWNDPLNRTTQILQLSTGGVREIERTAPSRSPDAPKVEGNPVKEAPAVAPVREWRFDEGIGDDTGETITGRKSTITGRKSLWRKGISGTALQFDGYNTSVSLSAEDTPKISGSLTLEGWIAIGAYPWNWCPIVHQNDDDGYFLGVDSHAHAGFKLKVGNALEELVSTAQLERSRWYQLVGTYDKTTGTMSLYVDGQVEGVKTVGTDGVESTSNPVELGKGKPRRITDPVGGSSPFATYAFDGLVDEVRIYDQALSASETAALYEWFRPSTDMQKAPDMDPRALPKFDTGAGFGAHYTRLKYHDVWDNLWSVGPYPDVVVGFDLLPTQFVFWRGVGDIPMIVNEKGHWYSNEFNETWNSSGGQGCQEPMSDKKSFFNHVRVIENTPARVVVQWRFPLIDVFHTIAGYNEATGWGDWSDWYYYIYPDGVAVKNMHLWTAGTRNHEFQESMAILGPNQHPEQALETEPALIMADLEGNVTPYSWTQGPPRVDYGNQKIHVVNYRAKYDAFTIGDFTAGNVYGGGAVPYSLFPTWNHWPTAMVPSDGRYASFPDRAAHCSLTHVFMPDYRTDYGDRPFYEKLLVEGMTSRSAKELVPLAKSWLRAPEIETVSDCRVRGYDPSQGAYLLSAIGASPSFRIDASPDRPIVNPCFVVKNWNCDDVAKVEIGSTIRPNGSNCRQGIVRDPNGRPSLVVWLEYESAAPVVFNLGGAKPELQSGVPKPATWAEVPRLDVDISSATMKATPRGGIGSEYFFECIEGPGQDSGWQDVPVYTDTTLSPAGEYAYRVKARDAYLTETEWSETCRVTTPPSPPPTVWGMDEGVGRSIKDDAGGHVGAVKGTVEWTDGVLGKALHLDGNGYIQIGDATGLASNGSFTWAAWIRTTKGGVVLARSGADREWQRGGKVMFIDNGRLRFDAAWVGATGAGAPVDDGKWHHVAVAASISPRGENVRCFLDGKPAGSGRLDVGRFNESGLPVRIGFCNDDFPGGKSGFVGDIDDVEWFGYALGREAVEELYRKGVK